MICAFSTQQFLSKLDTLTCGKCTYRSLSFHSHDLKYLGFTNAYKCKCLYTDKLVQKTFLRALGTVPNTFSAPFFTPAPFGNEG